MFSSSRSCNPFSYTNETLFPDSSTIEENPNYNSSQEEYPPPPFLFHFPSPFLDTGDPPHDHNIPTFIQTGITSPYRRPRKRNGGGGANTDRNPKPIPNPNPNTRRRTGKKDRHSKICTAQGVRDRRMRLSVHVARKFFDLQDLLGFDKASKTIEWLFSKSKGAIKELTRNIPRLKHGCSASTKAVIEDQESVFNKEDMGKGVEITVGVPIDENNRKPLKKSAYDPLQAKELRDKARERAKARTREKMMIRGLGNSKEYDQEANPNCLDHEFPNVGIIENFQGPPSANSSTSRSIFGFHNNPGVSDGEDSNNQFMSISGNWEMENARFINSDYGVIAGNLLQEQNPSPIPAASAYFQSQSMSGNQSSYYWWQ
ncbi:hypothetical protein Vadar_024753 [Vaccinium darrowii]|uniref:Uncharacterized protein n=1 Tax=Vaccinium darrowii TaxID=229202 RepID=A0ACB7XKH8_9ERIC|nr:hypothetical protein Vadar_024753 [Vaccinium darrowii]